MDEAAGVTVKWQNQDGNVYGQKLGAVLASSDIPDAVVVPGWELGGKIPSAIANKFADLGPYLSGDKVKDYPNLAAIPTGAWQRAIFAGKLRGLPMPAEATPNITPFYRADIFEEKGYEVPTTTQEFYDLCKEINAPKSKVWACSDMTWSAFVFFGVLPEKPYYWKLVDGKLVNRYETDEYLEALEWSRSLYSAGFVHPDAKAETGDMRTTFSSGNVLMYNADISDWYAATAVQRLDKPEFRMGAMDFFAAAGGDPVIYEASPSNIWCFVNKNADKKTIQDVLALANYTAAPYGTKEQRLKAYGWRARTTPSRTASSSRRSRATTRCSPPTSTWRPRPRSAPTRTSRTSPRASSSGSSAVARTSRSPSSTGCRSRSRPATPS